MQAGVGKQQWQHPLGLARLEQLLAHSRVIAEDGSQGARQLHLVLKFDARAARNVEALHQQLSFGQVCRRVGRDNGLVQTLLVQSCSHHRPGGLDSQNGFDGNWNPKQLHALRMCVGISFTMTW